MNTKRTSTLTWVMAGLFGISALIALPTIMAEEKVDQPPAHCLPIKPGSIWLPDDKQANLKALIDKAHRVNASGQCVIEGSWGDQYQKYYLAVSKTGRAGRDAYFIRFDEAELDK